MINHDFYYFIYSTLISCKFAISVIVGIGDIKKKRVTPQLCEIAGIGDNKKKKEKKIIKVYKEYLFFIKKVLEH